jgi:transglutaminase-like putative cysteine protease
VWRQSPELRGRQVEVPAESGLYRFNHAPGWPVDLAPDQIRRQLLRQEIYRDPLHSNLLFAADRPVAIEVTEQRIAGRRALLPLRGPMSEIRGRRLHAAGVRYVAYSAVGRPAPGVLRQALPLRDHRLGRFLQLPRAIAPRLRALARRITAGQPTIYDKTLAVQRYLQRNYRYTLDLRHDRRLEPLQEFLFHRRQGHCEYFATAMTLLLRALGIHARNINGFAGGVWNPYGGYLAIRQGDAHSWSEVLFPNVGWVAFDSTPAAGAPRTQIAGGWWSRAGQLLDAIRLRWFRHVIEYDLERQVALLGRLRGWWAGGTGSRWLTARRVIGLAALPLLALAGLALWRRRRGRAAAVAVAGARQRHPVALRYQRLLRLLARHGQAKPPAKTPREFARALRSTGTAGAAIVEEVTELYYRIRYGQQTPAGDDLARLEALLDRLKHLLHRSPRASAEE